jgi:hypothetical protein
MADVKKLALDKTGLQDFIDNQIQPFQNALDKVANVDTDDGVTIGALTGDNGSDDTGIFSAQKPLSIGLLASDKQYGGDKLVEHINSVCKSVTGVYTQQTKLFRDLHTNLNTTIKKLMDGQHDTLVKIDGKIFLDSLGTVPGDFSSTGSGQNQS